MSIRVRRTSRSDKTKLYWQWIKKARKNRPYDTLKKIRRDHRRALREFKAAQKRWKKACNEFEPDDRRCVDAKRKYIAALQRLYDLEYRYVTIGEDREGRLKGECVLKSQLLLGDNAEAELFQAGDSIMTAFGLEQVSEVKRISYEGGLVEIKGHGTLPFKVTSNHPILVASTVKDPTRKSGLLFTSTIWKNPSTLKPVRFYHSNTYRTRIGDWLVMPRYKGTNNRQVLSLKNYFNLATTPTKIQLNEQSAFLMGLYVAEGTNQKGPRFNLCDDETDYINLIEKWARLYELTCLVIPKKGSHGIEVKIYSSVLGRAFEDWFGKGAENKQIPDWLIFHNNEKIIEAFLQGYFAGDGWKQDGTILASTVSPFLALQIQIMGARLGRLYCISNHGKSKLSRFDEYRIRAASDKNPLYSLNRDMVMIPITMVKSKYYKGTVINLVEPSHTFLVNNVTTHNSDPRREL